MLRSSYTGIGAYEFFIGEVRKTVDTENSMVFLVELFNMFEVIFEDRVSVLLFFLRGIFFVELLNKALEFICILSPFEIFRKSTNKTKNQDVDYKGFIHFLYFYFYLVLFFDNYNKFPSPILELFEVIFGVSKKNFNKTKL